MKFVSAMFVLIGGFLIAELGLLGWQACSLRRIVKFTPSARTDVILLLVTAGLSWAIGAHLHGWFRLSIKSMNVFLQLTLIVAADSFVIYWHHRMMHTKWFWWIHKTHHSATEMNGITSMRNHPLDFFLNIPFIIFMGGFADADPRITIVYGALNTIYQMAVHSDFQWGDGWVGRWLVFNPLRHRLHHSVNPKHYNRNFGSFSIWDHVFGTYDEPAPEEKIQIGTK